MKTQIFLLLISILLLHDCSKGKDTVPMITFNDSSYIKIIAQDDFDSLVITARYSSHFPHQPCIYHQKVISEKGIYKVAYSITKPELVEIAILDTFYTYIIPADTLVIKVGIDSSSLKDLGIFCEIQDPIYKYFKDEKKIFGSYYFYSTTARASFNSYPKSQKNYNEAVQKINTWRNERLAFLEKNKQNLPNWFYTIQKYDYFYYAAGMKFYQYYHLHNDALVDLAPTDVKINNTDAIYSTFYWSFIFDYFILSDTVNNYLAGAPRMIALYEKASPKINSTLKGNILKYFNAYFLLSLNPSTNSKDDVEAVDHFIKNHNLGLGNNEIAYVDQTRIDKKKAIETINKNRLMAGEKAQSFYLKDMSGKLHTLSEFKDNIVYLHFWATWCGPCIKELPILNELYNRISNKPVVIVNICMNNNIEEWKEIINRENLKGVNLICQGKWDIVLKNSYSINSFPHYVLIDKNGLLIANSRGRPNEIYDVLTLHLEK